MNSRKIFSAFTTSGAPCLNPSPSERANVGLQMLGLNSLFKVLLDQEYDLQAVLRLLALFMVRKVCEALRLVESSRQIRRRNGFAFPGAPCSCLLP